MITATHPSYLSSDTNPTHSSHSQKVEEKEDGVELWCVILSLHSALQQLQAPSTLQALIENTKQWSSSSERFAHPYQYELDHWEPTTDQLKLTEPQVSLPSLLSLSPSPSLFPLSLISPLSLFLLFSLYFPLQPHIFCSSSSSH